MRVVEYVLQVGSKYQMWVSSMWTPELFLETSNFTSTLA